MPLDPAKSRTAFEHNIRTEVEAGKPQKQAVAIAYAEKGRGDADWRSRVDAACSMMDGLCAADKRADAESPIEEFAQYLRSMRVSFDRHGNEIVLNDNAVSDAQARQVGNKARALGLRVQGSDKGIIVS